MKKNELTQDSCDCEPFQSCQECSTEYKPKFEKPGKRQKKVKKSERSKIREIEKPTETHCRFCGHPDDETSYYHHCEIQFLKMKYGKGTGTKIDDYLSVWGHHTCGEEMSRPPVLGSDKVCFILSHYKTVTHGYIMEWENKWLVAIIETWLV